MDDGTAGGVDATLTDAEQDLVRAALAGEEADLALRPVRASVVRDLVLEGRRGWVLPSVGLRISRTVVQGCLDLGGCTLSKPLLFRHARFEGGGQRGAIILRDGRLKRFDLPSCTVEGNIVADRVDVEQGMALAGSTINGALLLRGAAIGGVLSLEGSEAGCGQSAIEAAGIRIKGALILRRAQLSGVVALPRAHLESGLYADGLQIAHVGIALDLSGARIGGDVQLPGAVSKGGISLVDGRLEGRLACEGLAVDNVPTAIDARGLDVSHGVVLDTARLRGALLLDGAAIGKGFQAAGIEIDGGEISISADVVRIGANCEMPRAKLIGQLRLPGARIAGQLRLTEARIYGTEIAVRGDGARIHGGCFLSRATVLGLVQFPAAEIGNQFRLRGATIKVEAGVALLACGASFRRDVQLTDGCEIVGAVVFDQARVSGTLDLQGGRLSSALVARAGLAAPGARNGAVVRADEIALSLADADIDRLVMPVSGQERPRGIVDLSRAHAGSFEDFADAWPPPLAERIRDKAGRDVDHLVLDGFTYDQLINPAGMQPGSRGLARASDAERVAARRIKWLDGQAAPDVGAHFKPQAWIALSSRLAHQGLVDDARSIDIARRRRARRSPAMLPAARLLNRAFDWFALYGHNPWRTVAWMAVVVVLFAGVWAGAARHCTDRDCFDETVFVVRNKDAYRAENFPRTYPGFHSLAYSFDVFMPIVSFGYEDHWRPNMDFRPLAEIALPEAMAREGAKPPTIAITTGGILYVLGVIEAILGLMLTVLMAAGFAGRLERRGD